MFLKNRSIFKVKVTRSQIMVPCESLVLGKRMCNMKSLSLLFEGYGQGKSFCSCTHMDANAGARAMTLAPRTYLSKLAKKHQIFQCLF